MKYLAIGAAVVAVALLIAAVTSQPQQPVNYAAMQVTANATATAVARAAEEQAATAPARMTAGILWQLIPPLALLTMLVLAAVWLLDYYRQRRTPLVLADNRGMYPVSRHALAAGRYDPLIAATAAGYHGAQIEAARRPVVATSPHTLTYSPTMQAVKGGQAVAELPALVAGSSDVPTFADLLQSGRIGAGQPLLLGYADGQPLSGGWKDLYSALLVGLSGSGKSTTLRFLACQSVLAGARLVVIDPHLAAGDESLAASIAPLAPAYLVAPPTTPAGMVDAIKLVHGILQQRLDGDKDRTPVIALVDEYTALITRSGVGDALAALLEAILQEGRKVNVIALAACQVPKGTRTGGTEVRDSFTSTYVHRTRRVFARMVTDDADDARAASDLPTGSALLRRTNGETMIVNIPNTTARDVEEVGKLLALPAPATLDLARVAGSPLARFVNGRVALSALEGDGEPATQPAAQLATEPATQPAATPDPRAERVKQMFLAGCSQNEIVQEVWGAGRKLTGQPKMVAHEELNTILRGLLSA